MPRPIVEASGKLPVMPRQADQFVRGRGDTWFWKSSSPYDVWTIDCKRNCIDFALVGVFVTLQRFRWRRADLIVIHTRLKHCWLRVSGAYTKANLCVTIVGIASQGQELFDIIMFNKRPPQPDCYIAKVLQYSRCQKAFHTKARFHMRLKCATTAQKLTHSVTFGTQRKIWALENPMLR